MGRHSYHPPILHLYAGDDAKVTIGNFCSIARGVAFMPGGNHPVHFVTTYPIRLMFGLPGALRDGLPATKGDITVGHDVWIGREAKILSGVTIGDGAVVGAFSVVTKDVLPYSIVAGAPAVHRRYRFDAAIIEALQRIRWWEWPTETIIERAADLASPDVVEFVRKYG